MRYSARCLRVDCIYITMVEVYLHFHVDMSSIRDVLNQSREENYNREELGMELSVGIM